ncbi:probable glutamate receptor [Panulirus ornatus]|uniref:probable glutamate receptor n=1 Tax=Panulirus ornatus TaxID=150431 RepID=UPI003A89CCA5
MCRGYFFLLGDPEPFLTFYRTFHYTWDYSGRYVLVLPSLQYFEAFIDSYIGQRTEQILGVVKSSTEGEWVLYMNQLYWGQRVRRINTWDRHKFTRQLDLFPDKLADLHGAQLKITHFNYGPYSFVRRAKNDTVLARFGMDVEIVKAVAHVLNATAVFTSPNERTWGEKYENGSWYGIMGQLHRREVDIGIAFYITIQWSEVPDLTAPYIDDPICFMTRMEPPLPHWQSLAFPFHQWTWLAVLVGLIVSGPLLFLLARASGRCGGERRNLQDLSFSWYYAFGVHFCEAHATLPRSTSTQVFVQFLWLYTMILTISYSANLKSFLLVKKQPAMMETFQDLYESGLEMGALGKLFRDGFAKSSDPYIKKVTMNVASGEEAGNSLFIGFQFLEVGTEGAEQARLVLLEGSGSGA